MASWVGSAPFPIASRKAARSTANCGTSAAAAGAKTDQQQGVHGAGDEELYLDDGTRNRQKELQDYIVNAEDVEMILSTARELDGAIVISTALHRLGKVKVPADVLEDPRFQVLLEKLRLRLPFFGSRQISNSLHGLGAINYKPSGPWVDMVRIQTQRRIRDFEPQHVSNTLWACARMQLQEPLMLRVLLDRAIEDIGRFCPLDVSIVTWACATLKLRDVEWLRAVVRTRLEFADFSPQNMSNFVWGLATLGFRNDNMVLAVGREAARKIQDFIPQELSNFCWALATMDLCDNLMLRAVSEEVERRQDIIDTWDPQSLSNMMWAYATLSIKDDQLFKYLIQASIARIKDHDPQNLANSSWAAAMVSFRNSQFLEVVAEATVAQIHQCQTLHLAQLAFALTRFLFKGEKYSLLRHLLTETLSRVEEFAPQSLFDVHDALTFFNAMPKSPNKIERCLTCYYEDVVRSLEKFATLCAKSLPTASQAAAYRESIERKDIVTLGVEPSIAFLKHFGLYCSNDDPFIVDARKQIQSWRAEAAVHDPMSRSIFHRAQCAWRLGVKQGCSCDALADGVFESGEPKNGGPSKHSLIVCRLRHPREGDAEISALCAALNTSILKRGSVPENMQLNLHLSDVPCVSCLGATLQFHFRYPGLLRVSFDRGRMVSSDTVPAPRPPPPPSRKGNPFPYAPNPDFYASKNGDKQTDSAEVVDRSMVRRDGPDLRQSTSFYSGQRPSNRSDGAASGGLEAVPHKVLAGRPGSSKQQTYYFSVKPDFYKSNDYEEC